MAMGMEDLIKVLIGKSEEHIQQQLEYVLQQIADPQPEANDPPVTSHEEEDAEDPEYGPEEEYDEFDDETDPDNLEAPRGRRQGEDLLCSSFLAQNAMANAQAEELRRSMDFAPQQTSPARPPAYASSDPYYTAAQYSSYPPPPASGGGVQSQRPPRRPSTPKMDQQYAAQQQQQQQQQQKARSGNTRSAPDQAILPPPSDKALRSVKERGVDANGDPIQEYQSAFGTRVKIPRTPMNDNLDL
jgi:hypothetical protein